MQHLQWPAPLIVPVVGNHTQQRNHVNANFEGSSSHLAILYEPLLGTFSDFVFLYIFVLYKLNVSKSYNCCCCTVSYYTNWLYPNSIFAHFICLSSPKANDWTAIRDGNNNRLSIGEFSFKKKGLSSYTEANNARDVIAMLYLMSFLQLEDYHVTTAHSTVTDTAMLRINPVIPLLTNNPSTLILLVVWTRNCVVSSSTTFLSRLSSTIGTPSRLKWLLHLVRRWLRKMLSLPSNATRWYVSLCALPLPTTFTLFSVKMVVWVGKFLPSNNSAPPVLAIRKNGTMESFHRGRDTLQTRTACGYITGYSFNLFTLVLVFPVKPTWMKSILMESPFSSSNMSRGLTNMSRGLNSSEPWMMNWLETTSRFTMNIHAFGIVWLGTQILPVF